VGCAKSPQASEEAIHPTLTQEPELIATATVIIQNTEMVEPPTATPSPTAITSLPTDREWHLLILGDSTLRGLGSKYKSLIERDVGVKVVLDNYVVNDLSFEEVIDAIKLEKPRYEVRDLPAVISNADVIVFYSFYNPDNTADWDKCYYYFTLPNNCNNPSLEKSITDMKWFWSEIFRLRNGQPTILRTMDLYNPKISIQNKKNISLDCTMCWENFSEAIRIAAEAYNIPFLRRYDAFNGVNHDEDPREKGYILADYKHPTDLGAQVIAELLAQMGYQPVPPP
jgi:hypothetical protein